MRQSYRKSLSTRDEVRQQPYALIPQDHRDTIGLARRGSGQKVQYFPHMDSHAIQILYAPDSYPDSGQPDRNLKSNCRTRWHSIAVMQIAVALVQPLRLTSSGEINTDRTASDLLPRSAPLEYRIALIASERGDSVAFSFRLVHDILRNTYTPSVVNSEWLHRHKQGRQASL